MCVVSESSRTTIEERSSLIVAVAPILHPTDPHGTHDLDSRHQTELQYAEEELPASTIHYHNITGQESRTNFEHLFTWPVGASTGW